MTASVYERVLGADVERLHPVLRRYVSAVPSGMVGRGTGVYAVAGSRRRLLVPVLRLLAWRRVLFPEYGRDVPFTIENRSASDGRLRAVREFRFPGASRRMLDEMRVSDGRIVDRLGRRGGLEVAFDARVEDGMLRLESRALAWRVRRLRVPLPPVAHVVVRERGAGIDPPRQHVDVRVRVRGIGEVFRYAGAFSYRLEPQYPGAPSPPAHPHRVGGRL
jgi:hypothetical protein